MKEVTKVQLINPPLSKEYSLSLRTGLYAPLNLATLTGYLNYNLPSLEVEILDGEMESWDMISMKINADIVGISANLMTYRSAIELANIAYDKGAKVIIGGPFPTSMPETILKNRPFIDAVVDGDGEQALLDYVLNKPYHEIQNLVYREGHKIKKNQNRRTNISTLPLPDYSSLNLEDYFSSFQQRYGIHKPFKGSLAISAMKGCKWRDISDGGCVFCMIPNGKIQYSDVHRVWKEIDHFNELYGVDYFWDVSDSFIDDDRWLKEFASAKPSHLNPSFEIYGSANYLTRRKAELLKNAGIFQVFVGAESGDDEILRKLNKAATTKTILKAVDILAEFDIKVTLSFVLGSPGETRKSLDKTLLFSEQLAKYNHVIETSTSVLMPIPGSSVYKDMMEIPKLKDKYFADDLLDLEEMRADWIKHFTSLTYRDLDAATSCITNMFELNSNFARPEHKYMSSPQC